MYTQLRALAYVHFCNNWFHYTMLAWLPTYFTDTLDLNLSQAAQARCLAALLLAMPASWTCWTQSCCETGYHLMRKE